MALRSFLPFTLAACSTHALVGTETGSTGGNPGTGGSGASTSTVDCSGFDEPVTAFHPTLRVTNARSTPVWFNRCFPRFSVTVGGEPLPGEFMLWATNTCQSILAIGMPCSGCEIEDQKIEPGAIVELPWSGVGYAKTAPPSACLSKPTCGNECSQGRLPDPGPIPLSFHLFANVENSVHPIDPFDVEVTVDPAGGAFVDVTVQ